MSKKITVVISNKTGKIVVDFEGFPGDDCFTEAQKLKEKLAELGIEIDSKILERKTPQIPEVENPRLKERE